MIKLAAQGREILMEIHALHLQYTGMHFKAQSFFGYKYIFCEIISATLS